MITADLITIPIGLQYQRFNRKYQVIGMTNKFLRYFMLPAFIASCAGIVRLNTSTDANDDKEQS